MKKKNNLKSTFILFKKRKSTLLMLGYKTAAATVVDVPNSLQVRYIDLEINWKVDNEDAVFIFFSYIFFFLALKFIIWMHLREFLWMSSSVIFIDMKYFWTLDFKIYSIIGVLLELLIKIIHLKKNYNIYFYCIIWKKIRFNLKNYKICSGWVILKRENIIFYQTLLIIIFW